MLVQSRHDGEMKGTNAAQYSGVKANFIVVGDHCHMVRPSSVLCVVEAILWR